MGIEYRISCLPEELPRFVEFLHRLGGRPREQAPQHIEFYFHSSPSVPLPDVSVVLERASICFCDHGAAREPAAILFRQIVDEALTLSDSTDTICITNL